MRTETGRTETEMRKGGIIRQDVLRMSNKGCIFARVKNQLAIMKNICFGFLMHIPYRLRRYRFFDIGQDHYYYDDMASEDAVRHVVERSYMPLSGTLLEMIRLSKNRFHCGIAIPGTTLELLEQYAPEMIDRLKQLVDTRCVEMVVTPYSYSLAGEYNPTELQDQLRRQSEKVKDLFGVTSGSVWNAELLYSDELAEQLYAAGYKTLMTEGARHILSWQSPNYLYQSPVKGKQAVLLRHTGLSDALSFHFSDPSHPDYPMDAQRFVRHITELPAEEETVNIWMGAETFGLRQAAETGIFEFLKAVPYYAIEQNVGFMTPSEAAKKLHPVQMVSSPYPLTWAGEAKDLSEFTGNDLQQEALRQLYSVAERVRMCTDVSLRRDWLLLQDVTYLSDMNYGSGNTNGYESPYDAFINYTNILSDFLQRVDEQYPTSIENEELNSLLKTIYNQEQEIAELKRKRNARRKEGNG